MAEEGDTRFGRLEYLSDTAGTMRKIAWTAAFGMTHVKARDHFLQWGTRHRHHPPPCLGSTGVTESPAQKGHLSLWKTAFRASFIITSNFNPIFSSLFSPFSSPLFVSYILRTSTVQLVKPNPSKNVISANIFSAIFSIAASNTAKSPQNARRTVF